VESAEFGIVQAKHATGMRMVRPEGELDMGSAPQLRAFVDRLWEEGVDEVFLDLSRLTFIDSRGLGLLVELQRGAETRARDLRMGGASPAISRLFEISGVVHILELTAVPEYEPPAGVS
jgi:anti-sigma B factor antagonist